MSDMSSRRIKRNPSIILLALAAVVLALLVSLSGFYVTPVLTYHMIGHPKDEYSRANTVSPESFKRQMSFIKKQGYRVLSLDEYFEGSKAGKNFCCHSVVITFDDGVLDNYTSAFPVLKENAFPAAFFVPTAKVGLAGQMTWGQLKEVSAAGITVGSHTVDHSYLPDVSREIQVREIKESKRAIELSLGKPAYYLAYPVGGFSEDVKKIVREAGYRLAFTTNRGFDRFNRDLFELKRIHPKNGDDDLLMWIKLTGFYDLLRKSKKPF
jgi:peptidoglycan/xylan/chitin deacetylase (PgdA/CDA1 family)